MQSPPGLNCWLTDRQGDYVAERKPSFVSPPKYGAIQKRVFTQQRSHTVCPSASDSVQADFALLNYAVILRFHCIYSIL